MKNLKGGFLAMVLSVLGVVLYTTMFSTVMTALGALHFDAGTDFIAFRTVVGISPTVLFLGGIFGAGFAYWRGYKGVAGGGGDPGGLMRMVLGVLVIILFVTMFATIITAMSTLYTAYSDNTDWVAFGTVLSISPTVLFLGGIFAGGSTAVGGYRARRRRRALR